MNLISDARAVVRTVVDMSASADDVVRGAAADVSRQPNQYVKGGTVLKARDPQLHAAHMRTASESYGAAALIAEQHADSSSLFRAMSEVLRGKERDAALLASTNHLRVPVTGTSDSATIRYDVQDAYTRLGVEL